MTTVNLRGVEYQIGEFTSLQLKPFAQLINAYLNENEVVEDKHFLNAMRIVKYILVEGLPDDLISIETDFPLKGFKLEIDELLGLYEACVKKLKEKSIFKDLDIETEIEPDNAEIKQLEERLAKLRERS
jgi:hypothetical protein